MTTVKTGRPVNTASEKTTIRLPHELKLALSIKALQQGTTVSALIASALRAQVQ